MGTQESRPEIETTRFKDLGEGYQILTRDGLLPHVEWVDWLEDEGALAQAVLEDDSEVTGAGSIELRAVWHENADLITPEDLANSPTLLHLGLERVFEED